MKFKRPLIKLITIGSLFFMFSLSFTGIVSLSNNKANNFWAVKKLNISFVNSTYADDDEGGEREERGERNEGVRSGGERNEGNERGERNEGVRSGGERGGERNERGEKNERGERNEGVRPTPAPINTNPNQTCKTVYDTVTTASGSTVQEPREVCTTNKVSNPIQKAPIQKAPIKKEPIKRNPIKREPIKKTPITQSYNTGLSSAEKSEIKSQFDTIYTKIVNISNTQSEINSILDKISNIITRSISTIQNKTNAITNIDLKNKYNKQLLILQELDTLVFDKTTGSNSIIDNILGQSLGFTPIKHVAPIGSTYTIIQSSNGRYTFQRSNGTYTNKTWNTPEAVIAYIDKNAVPATVNKTPIAKAKPIRVNKPKPIYRPKPVVRKPKPAPIYKPTPKPKPIPKPAPAPITTTTTAS